MTNAELLKSPYEISFTGNEMPFTWAINPYNGEADTRDFSLVVRVWVESSFNSNIFEEVYVQKMLPLSDGTITLDVASIVDPYLVYFKPRTDLNQPIEAQQQRKRYKVTYILIVDGNVFTDDESDILYAIKGGLATEAWHYKEFFTQVIAAQAKPLLFSAAKELVDPAALKYIYWIYPYTDALPQEVIYKVYFSDGSVSFIISTVTPIGGKWSVFCAPAGFNQVNLDSLSPGRFPVKYSITVNTEATTGAGYTDGIATADITNHGGGFTDGTYTNAALSTSTGAGHGAKATVVISAGSIASVVITTPGDNYAVNDTAFFLNSQVGGTGGSNEIKVTAIASDPSITITTAVLQEYFFNLDNRNFYDPYYILYRNAIGGMETIRLLGEVDLSADYDRQPAQRSLPPTWADNLPGDDFSNEQMDYTGDTGFLSRKAAMKLRDLLLSPEKYMLQDGSLLPINIASKKIKFYSNKDRLISTSIDWQLAFKNAFYTPGIMPKTRTCPAMEKFLVKQLTKSTLQILWAMEKPYDLVEVQVIIGSDTYTYNYRGNTGIRVQSFANPATTEPVDITVRGRTICNAQSNPVDYGAYTSITGPVIGNSLPVANNDYVNVPSGFVAPYAVPDFSLLTNDYDPDGDPIECVATTGVTVLGGVVYQITTDGKVTFLTQFYGRTSDYFDYQIHELGSSDFVTARCDIVIGNTQRIYAKWVKRNITNGGSSGDDITNGEAWIDFFSDPAGTVPIDVTGRGITVGGTRDWYYVEGTSVLEGPYSYSAVASGTKILLYTGKLSEHLHIPGLDRHYEMRFTVLAGTGYTAL